MTAAATTPLLWSSGAVRRRWARRNGWTVGVFVLLAAMIVYERIIHPTLSAFDFQSLAIAAVPLAFVSMAQAVVVIGGGIDLSVGPQMSVINVIAATWMVHADERGAVLISIVLILFGIASGAATGLVVSLTRVPDIIVTLATSFVWTGVALAILEIPGGGAPLGFINIFSGFVWNGPVLDQIPAGFALLLGIFLVLWIPFARSRFGFSIYALGSNRNAAFLSGVNLTRARVTAYGVAGIFTALAGLALTASAFGTGDPHGGDSYTLTSVAAIVLGGVSLTGGRGGLLGPVAAALILSLIRPILTFLNLDVALVPIIQGVIIVLIVMFAGLLTLRRRI
jgi:ribose transport system permease protein